MDAALTFDWHESAEHLQAALGAAQALPGHVLVSARLPLLADLTLAENIALPRAYHLNIQAGLARLQAREFMARLLPVERADCYPDELTRWETFAALWLRAVALPGQVLVLASPLSSFDLTEATLKDCAERCYGLYAHAIAHEQRAQSPWRGAA